MEHPPQKKNSFLRLIFLCFPFLQNKKFNKEHHAVIDLVQTVVSNSDLVTQHNQTDIVNSVNDFINDVQVEF